MATELMNIPSGLGFVEGPRWHEGRLWWFSDFSESGEFRRHIGDQPTIGPRVHAQRDLLVVSTHEGHILRIDDAGHHRGGLNDMLVDERGQAYMCTFPAHVAGQRAGEPSVPLVLVLPYGRTQVAAARTLPFRTEWRSATMGRP
jgi:sugar lactone lactonase YvrE